MKKLSFIVILGIALVLIFGSVAQPIQAESAVIKISGMRCNDCVDRIQSALLKLDGLDKAVVDLKRGSADVTFNNEVLKLDDIRTAITKIGYSADDIKAAFDHCELEKKTESKKSCSKLKACCNNKKTKSI
ncbi:MAG: heavy-metal-associated domain-containing protein [Fidelibacterota bacterium]